MVFEVEIIKEMILECNVAWALTEVSLHRILPIYVSAAAIEIIGEVAHPHIMSSHHTVPSYNAAR